MTDESGLTEVPLIDVLETLGRCLGFEVRKEVEAAEGAFVDMVWFDNRLALPLAGHSVKMRYQPVLPVVAFEIERRTAGSAKHVKGSASNLSNLGAQVGVIVIGNGSIEQLRKRPPHKDEPLEQSKKFLRDCVSRWVFSESQLKGRIIVMSEDDVMAWHDRVKKEDTAAKRAMVKN
jgi:hypothetical protein